MVSRESSEGTALDQHCPPGAPCDSLKGPTSSRLQACSSCVGGRVYWVRLCGWQRRGGGLGAGAEVGAREGGSHEGREVGAFV